MPIYEYKCKKCNTVSEFIQKFSDPPLTDCGECGTRGSLEKLLSLSAFHLKGSGWYVTDYARKDKKGDSEGKSSTRGTEQSEHSKKPSRNSDLHLGQYIKISP